MSVTVTHHRARQALGAAAVLLAAALSVPAPAAARGPLGADVPAASTSDADRLIVTYRTGTTEAVRRGIRLGASAKLVRTLDLIHADVVKPVGMSCAMRWPRCGDPRVAAVQIDHKLYLDSDPTQEPDYDLQWGLENAGGTSFEGYDQVPDVDIDASAAWGSVTGAGVTVAVIDDGVDFGHPDLAGQAWTNPGESGGGKETNGVDDDDNGYIDDVHGANVCFDAADGVLHVPGADFHGIRRPASSRPPRTVSASPASLPMPGSWASVSSSATSATPTRTRARDPVRHRHGREDHQRVVGRAVPEPCAGGRDLGGQRRRRPVRRRGRQRRQLPEALAGGERPAQPGVRRGDRSRWRDVRVFELRRVVDLAAPGTDICLARATPYSTATYCGWSGTSFAAPFVSGTAALLAQAQPTLLGNAGRSARADPERLEGRQLRDG